jgi:MFS family permease
MKSRLPRAVVWLGVVSLLTDASSDMIYPLLPLFLTTVLGASAATLGLIEGAAEATAALLKLWSGRVADRVQRRKPLTLFGYTLSSFVRPLAGVATTPWHILAVRLADRVGKGVRSSPRDALVADVTPPDQRGRAFGFHRAMDNAGAVLGPAAAAILLYAGIKLRSIFLLAALPGALALAALAGGVDEPERAPPAAKPAAADEPSRSLAAYFVALGLFSLGNASDAFLLLRCADLGLDTRLLPLVWMAHNGVRAMGATAGGQLSDRFGRRRLIFAGWLLYGLCYLGFGFARTGGQAAALLVVYAVHYALVEGSERALVADLAGANRRGTAFGGYYLVVGLAALPASLGFGWLLQHFGARLPFSASAGLALAASLVMAIAVPEPSRSPRRGS